MHIVSCSSSQQLCPIKKLIVISMRLWWSFQPRCSKQHSIRLIFQNLKRKSIDFSDQMLLISQQEFNTMSKERRSSHNSKRLLQMKLMIRKLSWKEWKWDLRSLRKARDRVILRLKLKSDHYSPDLHHMEQPIPDLHLYQWFSQVLMKRWNNSKKRQQREKIKIRK